MRKKEAPMIISISHGCGIGSMLEWTIETYTHSAYADGGSYTHTEPTCTSVSRFKNVTDAKNDWKKTARKWGLKKGIHWRWIGKRILLSRWKFVTHH